jgi:hypothetical protein
LVEMRTVLLTLALLLTAAAPAVAQDPTPQLQLGDPSRLAATPVKQHGARVGQLVVEQTGSDITATATFQGRPPGRRVTVCVTVAGDRECVTRRAHKGGSVVLKRRGEFTAALRARVRSGGASGSLKL